MNNYIKIPLAALLAFMLTLQVSGQSWPVTVSIAVAPPYYPKISLYTSQPGKIMAILTNTSMIQLQVYVHGRVYGEGIEVHTDPSYKMPSPVILPPGGSYQMNQFNIGHVFDADHLQYSGISKNEILYGNGVPEGSYTICLRVFDWQSNQPLSGESPQGCSNIFTITDIEPPVITSPVCGQPVVLSFPQNMVFNWTIPPGAPVTTQYNLKIIEVLPSDRNINDAVRSATHPVFFEKTMNISFCLLGPSDPQLVIGKTYAFAVTAIDPKHELAFRNNGMSEVCSFHYSGNETVINTQPIQLISPRNGDTVKDLPLFTWAPVPPRAGIIPEYQLRLTEILPGHNKDSAIHNSPHILKDIVTDTFPCPGDAVEPGKNYCWQVKAILHGAVIATSKVWAFSLPYFFIPLINLREVIVHIETLVTYDNEREIWVVEILLPSGEKIKVGFKDNPFLKICDYILIKEAPDKKIGKETWIIIKSYEKVNEAVAKKTWAKNLLTETKPYLDKASKALPESIKSEDEIVAAETKASNILDGMIKEGLPVQVEFDLHVKKAKEYIDLATDEETNPEYGARKRKEGVLKELPDFGTEIEKIGKKIETALKMEKDGKDDEDVKKDAIKELGDLIDKIAEAKHQISRAIDKEEVAKTFKSDAIEEIDKALTAYESKTPPLPKKSGKWKTDLNSAKDLISRCLPGLNHSIDLKKTAKDALAEIENVLTKAKTFMEDALAAEQDAKKK